MNIEYKYIVLQNGCVDRLFVFPKVFVHSEFFRAIRGFPENKGFRLVSGGFTDLKSCYGGSESLGVRSRIEDDDLLGVDTYGEKYAFDE